MATYSALFDAATNIVLAVTDQPSAAVVIQECTQDALHGQNVAWPNYRQNFFMATLEPAKYPEWSWNFTKRIFYETPAIVLTDEMRQRSALTTEKIRTIARIMSEISYSRYPVRTGVEFQEAVYLTKRMQAENFKASGYDESRMLEFPYVLQYADLVHISLKQAADDILFKAKLDDDLLSKTELLRLKYFRQIKESTMAEEMPDILSSFIRECYKNALV